MRWITYVAWKTWKICSLPTEQFLKSNLFLFVFGSALTLDSWCISSSVTPSKSLVTLRSNVVSLTKYVFTTFWSAFPKRWHFVTLHQKSIFQRHPSSRKSTTELVTLLFFFATYLGEAKENKRFFDYWPWNCFILESLFFLMYARGTEGSCQRPQNHRLFQTANIHGDETVIRISDCK
jgi:hypothetical protein